MDYTYVSANNEGEIKRDASDCMKNKILEDEASALISFRQVCVQLDSL